MRAGLSGIVILYPVRRFIPMRRTMPLPLQRLPPDPCFQKEPTMNNMLYLTIFLGVMTAMAPLSTDMYLPSLPEIASDFHISTSMT